MLGWEKRHCPESLVRVPGNGEQGTYTGILGQQDGLYH